MRLTLRLQMDGSIQSNNKFNMVVAGYYRSDHNNKVRGINLKKKSLRDKTNLLLFVGPAFISVFIITIIPFLLNIYYSFYKWDGISKQKEFVGFSNFIKIFTTDIQFQKSFTFTLMFAFVYIIIVNLIAILVAN